MSNLLTAVTPRLLAQGLMALRQVAIMPQLVNRGYDTMAGLKGSSIDIPIPSAITVQDVAPGAVPPSTQDIQPTNVTIKLNTWKEAPFYLSDSDMLVAMDGTIPMQASEAIKGIGNQVNVDLLGLGVQFFGYAGTAGTTPFATDTTAMTAIRKVLNNQLCPIDDRRLVLDPNAEANALALPAFQYVNQSGTNSVMQEGQLGRRLGFDTYMHQLVQSHTAGTLTGTVTVNGAFAANNASAPGTVYQTISLATAGGAAFHLLAGDIIAFAGDTQTYTVTADTASVGASSNGNVTISPSLKIAKVGTEAVTLIATHVMNLAFHRDAIAFATRPLEASAEGLGHIMQSAVDPLSGLALRLEISREHKRTRFSYDILYGFQVVRPELGARLLG